MKRNLAIQCTCGSFSAVADIPPASHPTRLVCYCSDCQTYARHLGQADRLLDDNGGTDLVQMSPAWFRITKGKDLLSILRLSPSGIYRWYASCCNTPICNTPSKAGLPYLGAIAYNMKSSALDNLVGPVKFGVGAGEQHPLQAAWPVTKGFGFRGLFGTMRNIGRWKMAGDHTRSELIDSETGEPKAAVTILSLEERTTARPG